MPIRVTEDQAKLLFGGRAPSKRGGPRVQTKRDDLPENRVESQILGFLQAKGWIVRRNHVGTYIPYWAAMKITEGQPLSHSNVIKIGQKGEADYTLIRPIADIRFAVEMFDLEIKAPGETPKPHQIEWMRRRTMLGFFAVWFDSYDSFRVWYDSLFSREVRG